jgi:predicted Zn-dependent protease
VQAAYNDPDACAGEGKRVCLVPLGSVSLGLLQYLTGYYLDRYGLEVHVLPPLDIPLSSFDRDRGQVLVDNLFELMYDHYRRWDYDGNVTIIGLTSVDILPADQSFMFSTYNRAQQRGLVSSARMNPKVLGLSISGQSTARLRVRKKLNVQIGVMHYGLQPSLEWGSALTTTYSLAEIDHGAADLPISREGALALSPPAPPKATPSPQASAAPRGYCTTDCFTPSSEIVSAFDDENACAGSEKRICIVPVGAVDPTLLLKYIDYFLERYGARINVLPPLGVNDSMLNIGRMQVIPEALDALVTTRYAAVIADPNVMLLTVTAVDIYYSALPDVPYALMVPGPFVSIPTPRRSLISYARLGDDGADMLTLRFQKLANRELGELYLGRAPEDNRESAMYGTLTSVPQLDEMAANLTFRR